MKLILILLFALLIPRQVYIVTFKNPDYSVKVRIVANDKEQLDSIARVYMYENGYTRYSVSTKQVSSLQTIQDTSINGRILIINE